MELPVVSINRENRLYRIYREPTSDDNLIREHIDDGEGNLTPLRARVLSPNYHHTYFLFDENDEISKTFKLVRLYTEGEGEDQVQKATYRELSDERHIDMLQTIITALQTRINKLENPVVTEGTLSANLSNITGNNTEYDIMFEDSSNASLWKEGKITLPTGLYHFSLILHLADVPLATNFIYVAVKIQPSDSTKTLQTFPYRVDADRLVRSTGALNVDTKSSYFRVTEESEVYFTVRVDGGGTDTIDLNSGTRVLIWR